MESWVKGAMTESVRRGRGVLSLLLSLVLVVSLTPLPQSRAQVAWADEGMAPEVQGQSSQLSTAELFTMADEWNTDDGYTIVRLYEGGAYSLSNVGFKLEGDTLHFKVLDESADAVLNDGSISSEEHMWNTQAMRESTAHVVVDGSSAIRVKGKSAKGMFKGFSLLETADMRLFDLSEATDLSEMFCNCSLLSSVNFEGVPKVTSVTKTTSMFGMPAGQDFNNALTSLDLSWLDTSQVTSLKSMFQSCCALATIEGIKNWDVSKVKSMERMFYRCDGLTELDLSGWETPGLKDDAMYEMFRYCESLKVLNLSQASIGDESTGRSSGDKDANYAFADCPALEELNLSSFDVSYLQGLKLSAAFENSSKLRKLTLGEGFAFDGGEYGTGLCTPPSDESFTGKWVRADSDGDLDGDGEPDPKTTDELTAGYGDNAATWAGTWMWEEVVPEVVQAENEWTIAPSIEGWVAGRTPNAPTGQALYGDVAFAYKPAGADDTAYAAAVPTQVGRYVMRASVDATEEYAGLTTEVEFAIRRAWVPGGEQPSNPTEPTDPVDPTGPTDPTDPVDPANPTNPTNPADPTNPTSPEDPMNPDVPDNPGDPDTPDSPTNPTATDTPGAPDSPSEADKPSTKAPTLLLPKGTPKGKSKIKLRWKAIDGAVQYDVYATRCGMTSAGEVRRVKQVLSTSKRTCKLTRLANGNKLRLGKMYKIRVKALDET